MKYQSPVFSILAIIMSCISNTVNAQLIIHKDPEIEKIVAQTSPDSLKMYIEKMVSFTTRHTLSNDNGIRAARNWVANTINNFGKKSNGRLTAVVDTILLQPDGKRVDKPTTLGNVVATLKGTDPNDQRIFIMSAHLDSRVTDIMNRSAKAPGANDDGSGVAALLETARVMSTHAFPATVIFVAFSGEEQGLLGAGYMAQKARQSGLLIEALLNNDIIGSNNSSQTGIINNTQVRVFSEAFPAAITTAQADSIRRYGLENDGAARQLARYCKEIGERYVDNLEVKLMYRNDRFLRGGDHSPFVEKGFTAVRITEMNENYEHQHQDLRTENGTVYGDLPAFMDFEYLRKNTAMNLAVLANLAKAPAKPAKPLYIMKGLDNTTTVTWEAAGHNTKGYYLLMRETSSLSWQRKIFTAETSIEVPYSKDNYFFAVQSVSAEGNESLPVVVTVK